MKKFLKLFSAFALIFCCMFSFVGCNIFEDNTKQEYANLVAERKIVREVVSNTKVMLESNIEQEAEPALTSSDISAKAGDVSNNENLVDAAQMLISNISIIDIIINGSDFVPGKIYNLELEQPDGTMTYFLLNAYCGEGDVVTLNLSMLEGSKDNRVYATASTLMSLDVYYNNEHKPIKMVDYQSNCRFGEGNQFQRFTFREMAYSSNGQAESYYEAELTNNYEGDSIQSQEKCVINVDNNGTETIYEGAEITGEIESAFDTAIEIATERSYIYSFARPLTKDVLHKLLEFIAPSES